MTTSSSASNVDWQRPAPTGRQQRWDVVTGLLLAAGTALSTVLSRNVGTEIGDAARPGQAEEIVWALAVALPLCLRRRYPLAVLVTCSIAFIGLQARFVAESTMSSICLFAALYAAGAWARQRRIADAVRVVVVVAMFCWLAYSLSATAWADLGSGRNVDGPLHPRTATAIYATLINVLFFAAAWAFGNASWSQARQSSELAERNQELQRERDQNARRAVIAERIRIARELHDVVAHHVSVMGVQAGAARRVVELDPALAMSTLTTIESAGRSALEEMHRLLGVLRDGESSGTLAPTPGLEQIDDLVAQTRGSGPNAELAVVGEPRAIPQSISVSLYRITQEALTNTVRHAGASRVDVRLRYLEAGIEVEVVDNGLGQLSPSPGSGLGHVGIRERVGLHGGELELGARPDGGYRVRARFPLTPLPSQASD